MIEHQHCKYRFVVSEGDADDEVWISLDPCGESPQRLKGWNITFALPEGTDYEGAEEIARYLNDNLGRLSLTGPVAPPHEESSTQH